MLQYAKLLTATALFALVSCGKITPKGSIESRDYKVENFKALDLEGKFRAFYIHSDSSFITVESYPNIIRNLSIDTDGNRLTIKERRQPEMVDFYNVTIYSKYQPEEISAADSVEVNLSSPVNTGRIAVNLKNNAKFIGALNAADAVVTIGGTARANFTGKVENAAMKVSDTASVIAPYWLLGNLTLQSQNGNYVEVNVKDSLKGSVMNTAKLLYYNDPIRAIKIAKTANVQNKILK